MFFRCFSCDKLKLKTKKTYELVIRGCGYTITKRMCEDCGNQTSDVYDKGLLDLEKEEFEDE